MGFELLKRTYPISKFDRYCDGYFFIINNISEEERIELDIDITKLQKIIKSGEKYIYQVAKENKEFKVMCLSFSNYGIIRKKIFGLDDE